MKLVSVDQAIDRLGLQTFESPELLDRLELILEVVSTYVETVLDTNLALASYVDEFYLERKQSNVSVNFPSFKLKNGFVNTGTVVVSYGYNRDQLGEDIVSDEYVLKDLEKGVMKIDWLFLEKSGAFVYRRVYPGISNFFRFEYTAGFDDVDGDGVYDSVPDWLAEVAFLVTSSVYKSGLNCMDDKGGSMCRNMISQLIGRKSRLAASSVKAL